MKHRVPVIYNDRNTILHRRDPRAKIVALAVLFMFIYVAPTWQWMFGMAVVGLSMAFVARVPPKWLAGLFVIQIPNAITYLLFPVVTRLLAGEAPLAGDFSFALKIIFSWWVALFVSVSIFTTMELTELTDGLRGLGVPELGVFTLEYIFLLFYVTISDFYRIMDAMKVKGINIETKNPITLVRNLPKLGLPMFLTVLRRSDTMMAVLKMRGYSFTEHGELRSPLKFDAGDVMLVALAVGIVGGTTAVRYGLLDLSAIPVGG